jgi:hypothetical protein
MKGYATPGKFSKVERNVFRVEHGSFRGYRVMIVRGGRQCQEYVSDAKVGGRMAALREAQRIKRELEARLPPPHAVHLRTRNSTGVPGVTRVVGLTRRGTRAVPRYLAFWVDAEGRGRTRAYSIGKYGEGEAFRLAVEARRAGVLRAMRDVAARVGRGQAPEEVPGLVEACEARAGAKGQTDAMGCRGRSRGWRAGGREAQ